MYFCRRNWSQTSGELDETPTGGTVLRRGVFPRGEAVLPEEARLSVSDLGGDGDPLGANGFGLDANEPTPFYLGPENRGYAEQPVEFGAVGAEKLAERDGEDLDGAAAALRAEAVFFGGEDFADADGGDEARPRDRRAGDERHDGAFRGYAVERRQHAALLGVVVAVLAAELVGGEGGALDGHVTAQLLARDGLRLARMAAERTAERNGGELGGREGRWPPTSSKTLISGRART